MLPYLAVEFSEPRKRGSAARLSDEQSWRSPSASAVDPKVDFPICLAEQLDRNAAGFSPNVLGSC